MKLVHQSWLCLEAEDVLHAAKQKSKKLGEPIAERFWRRISLRASKQVVLLELVSVNEEEFHTKQFVLGQAPAQYGLTWEDLEDSALIVNLLAREQFQVGTSILRLFRALKKNKAALLEKLP